MHQAKRQLQIQQAEQRANDCPPVDLVVSLQVSLDGVESKIREKFHMTDGIAILASGRSLIYAIYTHEMNAKVFLDKLPEEELEKCEFAIDMQSGKILKSPWAVSGTPPTDTEGGAFYKNHNGDSVELFIDGKWEKFVKASQKHDVCRNMMFNDPILDEIRAKVAQPDALFQITLGDLLYLLAKIDKQQEGISEVLQYDSECKQILSQVGIGHIGMPMPERCAEAVERIMAAEA